MAAAATEFGRRQLAADGAENGRRQHDPREVELEEEDADEGQRGDDGEHFVLDRLGADTPGGK